MATATKPVETIPPEPVGLQAYETVIDWSENHKFTQRILVTFSASSYQTWADALSPQTAQLVPAPTTRWAENPEVIPVGKYYLYRRLLKMYHYTWYGSFFGRPIGKGHWERFTLPVFYASNRRAVSICFDAPVSVPVLAELQHGSLEPWMSLTPNEIVTLRAQVRRAKGRVGMAGLGMGWQARRVLERKSVKHLTVVEKDPALLEYFGGVLQAEFGDRLTLVEGDAYEHVWDNYDVSLWDIWEKIGDAAWDQRFLDIRERLRDNGKVCEGWTCWTSMLSGG